jgi:uncharacterized protein (TIGR02118 family)
MVKVVLLLSRRPELSHEAFLSYWVNTHAPLVWKVPKLRRYVISSKMRTLAGEPQPDGLAELWFDDMASLDEALKSEAWRVARADGENFRTNSIAFVTDEQEIAPAK